MQIAPPHAVETGTQADQTLAQLHFMYQGCKGWAWLGYIEGDPSRPDEKMQTGGWYAWPKAAPQMAQDALWYAEQHGDVYAGQSLHKTKTRNQSTALPSRIVWNDDLAADAGYSLVVRSSEASKQAYILLDTPQPVDVRSDLQRRWAATVGADKASADPVKPVRLAGGFNTKRFAHFPVAIEQTTNAIYSVEELSALWPPVDCNSQARPVAPLDIAAVELKRGNVAALLKRTSGYLPTMAKEALAGEGSAPSASERRYRVVYGLASVGFPDDEIAALIWYWADLDQLPWGHIERKSLKAKSDDISRCIAKSRAALLQKGRQIVIKPTTNASDQPATPLTNSKARKDRPQRVTPDQYLIWAREHAHCGVLMMTLPECAAAHGISTKTVSRIEQSLGLKRQQSGQHGGFLRLDIIAAPVEIIANAPAETVTRLDIIAAESSLKNGRSGLSVEKKQLGLDSISTPPVSCLVSPPSQAQPVAHVQPENSSAVARIDQADSAAQRPAQLADNERPQIDTNAQQPGGVLLQAKQLGSLSPRPARRGKPAPAPEWTEQDYAALRAVLEGRDPEQLDTPSSARPAPPVVAELVQYDLAPAVAPFQIAPRQSHRPLTMADLKARSQAKAA